MNAQAVVGRVSWGVPCMSSAEAMRARRRSETRPTTNPKSTDWVRGSHRSAGSCSFAYCAMAAWKPRGNPCANAT